MSFFTFVPASYFDSSLAKEIIISPKPTSHPLIPAATTSGPHKACELLLVSCNGSPLSDAVFTQKSQKHFSSWPQITKLIHHPHFQSTWLVLGDQKPLFFITVKCHDYRKVSCCPKTAIILFFFFFCIFLAVTMQKEGKLLFGWISWAQQARFRFKVMKWENTPTRFYEQVWIAPEWRHISLLIVLTPLWELPLHPQPCPV